MSLRSSPLVIAIDVGGTWAELIGVDNKRAAREIATLPDKARVVPAAGPGVWIDADALRNQLALPLPYSPVTLTRRPLEAGAVCNRDVPAAVRDEPGFLESAHRHRHARPSNPEHCRKGLLGEIEPVASNAVVRHEKPSRAPLLDYVKPVARCRLRDGLEHELAVTVQQAIESRTLRRKLAEIFDRHPPRIAADLPPRLESRRGNPMKRREGQTSIIADCHCLDLIAVLQLGDERNDAVFREMSETNGLFPVEYDLFRLDRHHLRSLEHSRELSGWEKAKNFVADDSSGQCSAPTVVVARTALHYNRMFSK
jgi:hypothetical protein